MKFTNIEVEVLIDFIRFSGDEEETIKITKELITENHGKRNKDDILLKLIGFSYQYEYYIDKDEPNYTEYVFTIISPDNVETTFETTMNNYDGDWLDSVYEMEIEIKE